MTEAPDIVERLIKIADASRREDGTDIPLGEHLREAAAEIERLRAALAAEREKCARVAEDFEAQVRNNITKTVDMQGDFGAICASKRIAAAIRGLE